MGVRFCDGGYAGAGVCVSICAVASSGASGADSAGAGEGAGAAAGGPRTADEVAREFDAGLEDKNEPRLEKLPRRWSGVC